MMTRLCMLGSFSFFRQILATSKKRSSGAVRRLPLSRLAMFEPSGSPKSNAPIAEASTILTSISISPNDVRRLRSGLQSKTTYLTKHFLHTEGRLFPDSVLKNGQKLTLQRTMILLWPGQKPLTTIPISP